MRNSRTRRVGPWGRKLTSRRYLNRWLATQADRHGAAVLEHRPVHVYLQIASGCNLDCYMCSEHNRSPELRHGRGLVSLSREIFHRIEEEIFPYSTELTLGVGGEPMLSENFEYFIERAFDAGQRISLVTNGTRILRPGVAKLLADCVANINISMDSADPANYERIRRGSKWKILLGGLDALNEHRMVHPPRERSRLSLTFVLMRTNVHELPAYVEFAAKNHADSVHAQHVIPVTAEGEDEMLTDEPERYNHFRALAMERAREVGIRLHTPDPFGDVECQAVGPKVTESARSARNARAPIPLRPERDGWPAEVLVPQQVRGLDPATRVIPCHMPTMDFYVLYDGRVFPCCHPTAHQKMMIGDLRDESFLDIWNNHLYRSLRAGFHKGDVPDVCKSCSIVHDPPPLNVDPEVLARSPALNDYYAGRDVEAAETHTAGPLMKFLGSWTIGRTPSAQVTRKALHLMLWLHGRARDLVASLGRVDSR